MQRRRTLKVVAVIGAVLVALVAAGTVYVSRVSRQSAIATAATWARLAPLPPSARNVRVETKGSMFTREIVVRFDATPAIVQRWLAASPGPASATVAVAGPVTTYAIAPGGGAQFAEVKFDASAGTVTIHTFWS